jgi:mono/diheme cytochrome c family protein
MRGSWLGTSLSLLTIATTSAQAYEPQVNYQLQCMGCHTPDGRGEAGRVPSVRNTLVPFASYSAGRKFLVQVPGAAQSRLSDAELADLINWMLANLSATPAPQGLQPFDAAEVARYRSTPLTEVKQARRRLLRTLKLSATT